VVNESSNFVVYPIDMVKITIRNIGPIADVDFEIKKVNIFMGPQSSGKSTIAKIISYCQWVEKRYILDGEYTYDVREQLMQFHRLGDNYFSDESFFEYESDFVVIKCVGAGLQQVISEKGSTEHYMKPKNIFIPSERNFVSAIPNLSKYKETNDNVMSFLYDWYTAKRKFNKGNPLAILNLGVDFYNNDEKDADVLILNKNKKEIQLRESSSGLQSITPLILLVEYLSNTFYNELTANSVDEKREMEMEISKRLMEMLQRGSSLKNEGVLKEGESGLSRKDVELIVSLVRSRMRYHHTNFVIEEPEQNLFPETQRDFIYYLFEKINDDRGHSLTLTTHSPYILYAINNCLMGNVVADKMSAAEKDSFLSNKAWISPSLVNIFEIDKNNGTINSIKDSTTGTVSKHYFNKVMNNIMDEYYELLNYFAHEG
jgi:ABC-type ATPase involved in cell division